MRARYRLNRGREVLASATVFVVLGLAVVGTWRGFQRAARHSAGEQAGVVANQGAHRLEDFTKSRFLVLEAVRKDVRSGYGTSRESFLAQTENLLEQFGGFQAINWIDADGVIRWVSPLKTNETAVGRNVFDHPVGSEALRRARESGEPQMTPPLDLFQGGRGFTTYFPVVGPRGKIDSYVNGVFRIDRLVEGALSDGVLDRFDVVITDGEDPVFGSPEAVAEGARERVAASSVIRLMGRAWEMRVAPKAAVWGTMRGDAPRAFLLAGLALAAAMALLAHALLLRQLHDRERQALERELQQSRKMEAIGQLAGGVAHDFNNVLTAILVNTGLARGAVERRMQPDSFLDRILEACERATDLTTQLLTFSRKQVVEEVPVDLSEEVARQRTLVSPIIRDNVALVQDLDPDCGIVRMHRGHVSQLMMNLLGNAVDAMPDGGEIRISTRAESRSPRGNAGRWAVLSVGDDGVGMTEDVRARVLEPFFTTKAVGKGTGLGLATVYGIATGAGGFVEIRSAPGLGTTVEVWLPVTASRPRREATPIPVRTGRLQGRVLLVEDDPAVLDATGGLLRQAGLEVVPAVNGREALDAVRHGAAFDVVVTDAVMPQLGGLALVRELRAIRPAFGAVVCSAYAGDIRTEDLKQADAVFVAKPFTPDALLEAIRRQMARAGVGHEASAADGRPTPGSP